MILGCVGCGKFFASMVETIRYCSIDCEHKHAGWIKFNEAASKLTRYEWVFLNKSSKDNTFLKNTEHLTLEECALVCEFPWAEGVH